MFITTARNIEINRQEGCQGELSDGRSNLCLVCNKTFTQKSSLDAHLMLHSREKPHKCQLCDKVDTNRGHLRGRVMLNTGERPHKCSDWEKAFITKGDLKRYFVIQVIKYFNALHIALFSLTGGKSYTFTYTSYVMKCISQMVYKGCNADSSFRG